MEQKKREMFVWVSRGMRGMFPKKDARRERDTSLSQAN